MKELVRRPDAKDNQVGGGLKRKKLERSGRKIYQLRGVGDGTEKGRQRQPGRRRSEEERAGTEPDAKIDQLGGEGVGTEIGRQRQPGRRSSEEERAGMELRKNW